MILIETERLILREITVDDAETLFKLDSDPEVQKYTGDYIPKSIEDVKERIKNISASDYSK